ncbi:hypothetical protein KFL_001000270 [Klebsormidium nitens]|uniref:CASP-like protein n=1 Tax=Klebsormidium nitens TaxID=105231 RepID=A0A1Y1HTZ5_KLENI|nr:hypothetical protein KFL_001000270 [Klebsormidium nitens]|eukprot:GAQ82105.1 hypothetical protein KFL_001000270 [Klebsormidium nitens]
MAELVEEETWVQEAGEEEELTPVPSAVIGRTIPVEGRPERPRAEAAPPAERRREAEPGVKPPVAAGPSVPPAKEPPRAPPPTAAPAAAPPERPPARPLVEAAAPARPPREEKKAGKKKLKERLAGIGRGRHWAHIGGVLLRFLQLAAFCVAFSVIAASGDNGLLFSDFQAFTFLVAATVIGATWTLCMLLNEVSKLMSTFTRQAAVTTLDVAILLLVYGAACASAALTTLNDRSARPAYPRGICQTGIFSKFCSRTKASTAFGFIGFGFLLPSVIWGFYGTAKEYIKRKREGNRR